MINLTIPQHDNQLRPRITVIGVGGAGGNAVNNMIRSNLEGVEFVVANTDAQALTGSEAERKVQLGIGITQGLGAGARPDVGRAAAEEAIEEIATYLEGSHMAFVTAGLGGGTGTGAAPVVARAAREMGILTVGVVTKPFHFEGAHRMRLAEEGLNELQEYVDTLIVIPNQNLFRIANEKTTFADAFKMADQVLDSGVRGVTDLMVMPGLINLDFADIRTVMAEMGKAMMGTGEADGERRAIDAAEAAISNPLLDDVSMKGARGVLVNITGGLDMTLYEVDEAVNRIRDEVEEDANIIFGSTFEEKLEGRMRVSVVATGIDVEAEAHPHPNVTPFSAIGQRPAPAPEPQEASAPTAQPQATQPTAQHPMGNEAPVGPSRYGAQGGQRPAAGFPQPVQRTSAPAAHGPNPAAARAPQQQPQASDGAAQPTARSGQASARPRPVQSAPQPPRTAAHARAQQTATAQRLDDEPSLMDYAEDNDAGWSDEAEAPHEEMLAEPEPQHQAPPQAAPRPHVVSSPQAPAAGRATGERQQRDEAEGDGKRKRAGGLFRRVTGLIREDQEPQERPQRSAPAETAQEPARPARQPAGGQSHLAGVQTTSRPLPKHDDDGLDIPAFLRRQAN
jgi:cell division protein FtsZ